VPTSRAPTRAGSSALGAFNGTVGKDMVSHTWRRMRAGSQLGDDVARRFLGAILVGPQVSRSCRTSISRGQARHLWRHLIENLPAKLKEFRAIAAYYGKADDSFDVSIHLAAAVIAARQLSSAPDLKIGFRLEIRVFIVHSAKK
jgi:hypothetical protein